MALLSVLSWFGFCAIQLQHVISNVLTVVAFDVAQYAHREQSMSRTPFGWKLLGALVLGLAIVPVSLKTSAKDLQAKAYYAVYAMFAMSFVEVVCAFINGMSCLRSEEPPNYEAVGDNIAAGHV